MQTHKIRSVHKREIATSLTSITFLFVGITGVMMFFRIHNGYIKSLHEIFGIVFFLSAAFHLFYNFKAMKRYFTKKAFVYAVVIALILAAIVISIGPSGDQRGRHRRGIYSMVIPEIP